MTDLDSIYLSFKLAACTLVIIIPFGTWVAHQLQGMHRSKPWIEAALALPLVLPPTVLGYYLLVGLSGKSIFGISLVFSFAGILLASLIVNLPFAIQPIQRAFEAIPADLKEAAQCSGHHRSPDGRPIDRAGPCRSYRGLAIRACAARIAAPQPERSRTRAIARG